MLELVSSGKLDKSEVVTLTKRFRDMLVQTDVFNVLERDKMDNILKEQDFILSDNCNSAECAVQVGQLLGVESVITGDIGKIGNTWTVSLRLVDMTTGKIEKTETMDYQGDIDGLLDVMRQIAFIFAGKDPPKSKATLIIQTGKVDKPAKTTGRSRLLFEPLVYLPVLDQFTFDNKSWHDNNNKVMYNQMGVKFSVSYMVTQNVKVGISSQLLAYFYKDTIGNLDKGDLAAPTNFTVGPNVGYYFTNGRFKPFIEVSTGFFMFKVNAHDRLFPLSDKDIERIKNLKDQSGFYTDITVGVDIQLFQFLDFRMASHFIYAKTKPMYGSGALSAGLVFHAGKGFPSEDK